jgi:catechol 2,3-dioxygenase-like lactoylglutathione lyase family enzyme
LTTSLRLRQVALVARDLERTVEDVRAVLGLEVGFRDPGVALFGLANAVFPVGDTFLEFVSPVKPDASAARLIEKRGGDAGYMVIVQTDDLAGARERMKRESVRVVFEHAHEAGHTSTIHLHPRDTGGAILSLDESNPPASWDWAGPDWRKHVRTDVVTSSAGATLASSDPAALVARWAAILDRPATRDGDGHAIALDGATLRFVRGVEGFVGVDLFGTAKSRGLRVEIAGTALSLI